MPCNNEVIELEGSAARCTTISVTHSTVYHYDVPVILEPHILRLRPRSNSAQRLLAFHLQIAPLPAGSTECLDQDGTVALNAWFNAPTQKLEVLSRFTVEMHRENPFDYLLAGEALHLPMRYPELLRKSLRPYLDEGRIAQSVRQYAAAAASAAQGNTQAFLLDVNRRVFESCRHIIRPDGPAWTSDRTLGLLEGSCRDLALLLCDVCRVVGIAARFVSGYECASAASEEPYMHAWAEVYLPGIGWRGYDPARGLVVSNGHVAVAAGFDPDLAAPVAGWFSGQARARMETSLHLAINRAE